MRPGGYKDERQYADALAKARLSVPEQINAGADPTREHCDKWPCGCKLPWWGYRRGYFHLFIMPDGTEYVYERCAPSTVAKQEAVKARRLEIAEAERKHRERTGSAGDTEAL